MISPGEFLELILDFISRRDEEIIVPEEPSAVFFWVKIVLGAISLAFFLFTIVWLDRANAFWKIKQWWWAFFTPRLALPDKQLRLINEWQVIKDRAKKGDEANIKLAIIEADKLFDDLLIKIGYRGKDMGDRLKQISPAQLSVIENVWRAHKVRNSLVHDPRFRITHEEAGKVVDIFESALDELEVL